MSHKSANSHSRRTRARRRSRRPAAQTRRRSPRRWLSALRQSRRRIARYVRRQVRKAGRAMVRRSVRAVRRARWHYELRAANRRLAACAALASPATVRSITGRPRPALSTATAPGVAAPMEQRVRRDKGGRFNGSVSSGTKNATKKTTPAKKTATAKKAAAKKSTTKKLTADQRKAAAFSRSLQLGNQRSNRIDKRLDATEARIDRMFLPQKSNWRNPQPPGAR